MIVIVFVVVVNRRARRHTRWLPTARWKISSIKPGRTFQGWRRHWNFWRLNCSEKFCEIITKFSLVTYSMLKNFQYETWKDFSGMTTWVLWRNYSEIFHSFLCFREIWLCERYFFICLEQCTKKDTHFHIIIITTNLLRIFLVLEKISLFAYC